MRVSTSKPRDGEAQWAGNARRATMVALRSVEQVNQEEGRGDAENDRVGPDFREVEKAAAEHESRKLERPHMRGANDRERAREDQPDSHRREAALDGDL